MVHSKRFQVSIRSLPVLAIVVCAALAMAHAGHSAPPTLQIRMVFVTEDLCGIEGTRGGSQRSKTLACVARGGRLQLYDWRRDAIYDIVFASEEQRIDVLNNHAGTEIAAEGVWNDRDRTVKLRSVAPFTAPEDRNLQHDE